MRRRASVILAGWLTFFATGAAAQHPDGLAATAVMHPSFSWIRHDARGVRVHFLAESYAAMHRDSLRAAVSRARERDLAMLGVDRFDETIDVFFVDSREQMDSLVGYPVAGFADRDGRGVFVVTNADWRSFHRHELMHVLAHHTWGPVASPGTWITEGLAQYADGRCGGYTVDTVAHGLIEVNGAFSFNTLVTQFRALDDLTAYLQAASIVGYLYETHGREAVRTIWRRGVGVLPEVTGSGGDALVGEWESWVARRAGAISPRALEVIGARGCG